jgi:serine/threonine protein kinase
MATLTGRQIGGYLIQEELGRGAMGVVFKARQLSMDRDVALKFLPKRLAQDEKLVARFLREARAAGQLSHPNIVGVHDAGVIEGLHFIAMEYVDGNSVHNQVREKGPYGEKEVLDIAGQIAEALRVAHARGILHRDIKPDNFLIDTAGRVRLADLGLARIQSKQDAELTQDGEAMGTPHYMSPEQCRGGEVDSRSDLYSLGASMYVMSTNQTPYDAATAAAVMVKVLTEPHRPIKKFNPNLSQGFVHLVEKLMSKDPARRFPDAQHVVDAIEKCRQGSLKPGTTAHPKVAGKPLMGKSRLKLLMYGAGAAIVALIALGILSSRNKNPAQTTDVNGSAPTQPTETKLPEKTPESGQAAAATKKTDPVPVVAPDKTTDKPAQPIPNLVVETETEKPEFLSAMKEWRILRLELNEKGRENPEHSLERIEEFLKKHPAPRIRGLAEPLLRDMRDARQKMLAEWDATQEIVDKDKTAANKIKSFFALMKFYEAHPGSQQAAEAAKLISGTVDDVRKETNRLAEDGEYKKAEGILTFLISKVPEELTGPIKEDLARVQAEHKKALAFAEVDQRAYGSIVERAGNFAREADSAGKRFNFEGAAQSIRENIPNLHAKKMKTDAEALAAIYTRASDVMKRMKLALEKKKAVDLQGLGSFKSNGQLAGWDDRGLTFQPPGLPPQPVPWKAVTGENLIQISEALDVSDKPTASELFDLGSLAFAAGVNALAIEKLQMASELDLNIKAKAEFPLSMLKPAGAAPAKTDREALAKQLFADAGAARAKKDNDAALKMQQRLIVEYADTQFVQANRLQIQELGLPGKVSTDPEQKDKPVATKPETDTDKAKAEMIADLKKRGFTEITGDWTQDPKRKTLFNVTNGQLFCPIAEAATQLSFKLEEGAKIGIYVRQENETETFKALQEKFETYSMELGRGYGLLVTTTEATIYGDRIGTTGGVGSPRAQLEKMAVPTRLEGKNVQNTVHNVTVSARGDKLEISLDGKIWRSQDKLRSEGGVSIVVEGNAQIDSPVVGK